MRSTSILAALAALSSTALAATCQAQNIVDACISGYDARIEACRSGGNDWICLCDVYTDVYTCYNNCPDSVERSPAKGQMDSFCQAAAPLRAAASSSMASVASVAKTATTAAPTSSSASATGTSTATGTSESAAAFATGAASLVTPAGAAAVALLAAAGLL
ncbi:hypothetical protein C7974DRAFT_410591 [Boeremia exigua]|uniref:uncharacterized protein n=1 Tax=Boeremia exigua TaxID=749465 RepID=UPI001E8EF231|nr:uncharacterized protein C7974DRAFT_410591 [Boeremia exigua]KAH6639633.1 hypothetical protein C7974DRAFT_410591 [Boeremia exigua]